MSGAMSISTLETASGWQSGISSWVRFAAMMPAMRAAPSTSPFLALPLSTRSSVFRVITTRPSATAIRAVAGLAETSTMRASPRRPRWVSLPRAAMIVIPPRWRWAMAWAQAARASPPRHRLAASGFRRRGRWKCRLWPDGARSPAVKMPLSPTTIRSAGTFGARRSLTVERRLESPRSRLLMPISRERSLSARSSSCSS